MGECPSVCKINKLWTYYLEETIMILAAYSSITFKTIDEETYS